jgi:hypothetical protein
MESGEPGQKLVEGKFKKTLYFLKINYDLPVLLKARSQFLLEQGRTGITFDTDVVVDTPPEKDAPVDIVSEHAEEAEVIQETITSAAEDTTAGAAGGEEPGTHQPSQPGDGATKASQKPADILKELAPFFKMLKDGKPIITNTDVAVIYKKLGVKAETKPSAVAPEKLPALLVEVKALVEKKKTATAEPAGGKKSGPGVKKTEDPF